MSTGNSRHRVALGFLGAASLVGLGAVTLAAAGAWQGCSIYNSSLLGGEAGADAGPATCNADRVPVRNDASDTDADIGVIAAMRSIDVGVSPGTMLDGSLPGFGYDLDNTCTCPGPPSCVQAPDTSTNCDDSRGRDHIALTLFRDLGMTAQQGSEQTNAAMNAGLYGIIIQVTAYDGMQDDPRVSAAIYASNGLNAVVDGGTPNPQWDGHDQWTVDPQYLNSAPVGTECNGNAACTPIYKDDEAYVVGYQLVATFPQVPLTFGSRANIGGALMRLSGVTLVGQLSPVSSGVSGLTYEITNGSISGRWRSSDLLANMATIPDPTTDGSFFCGNDSLYPFLKQGICALQDIATQQASDNTGAPCDALSMGFAFTAGPALLGQVFGVPAAPQGCGDAGVTWQDQCQ